ncbi:hypothetical protein BASA81_008296 [Batrachochytrium salamandrivorans]|nr:hypothetical protein BASA81_008296 [Batrachochytrium salamandrivorans]
MFTPAVMECIARQAIPFKNQVAFNAVLPPHKRPLNVNYEERLKRSAAVLVPLCNVEGVASLLFTVRATNLSTHAAQVAFPGGHVDVGETPESAALRELEEETNLKASLVAGSWMSARAYTGTMVTPVLGLLPNMTRQQVEQCGRFAPKEVSQAFSLPIEHLVDPANRLVDDFTTFRSPRFLGGPQPIWGLTAYFLEGILKDVLGPSMGFAYTNASITISGDGNHPIAKQQQVVVCV